MIYYHHLDQDQMMGTDNEGPEGSVVRERGVWAGDVDSVPDFRESEEYADMGSQPL